MPLAKWNENQRRTARGATTLRRRRGILLPLAFLGLGAGCHLLPVHRIDPSIDPRRVGRPEASSSSPLGSASDAPLADRSVPLPPLPLLAMSDEEVLQKPASTPLLDAALQRAQALQDNVTSELGDGPVEEPPAGPISQPEEKDVAGAMKIPDLREAPIPVDSAPEIPQALPDDPITLAAANPPQPEVTAEPARTPVQPRLRVSTTAIPPSKDPWGDGINQLRMHADAQITKSSETAETWRLRRRVLDWLAEDEAKPDRQDGSWSSVLSILAAATPDDGPVDLRATARAFEERAPLEITSVQLCRKVSGFGTYEPFPEAELKPNQAAVLYCELSGVESVERDGAFHSELEASISLRSPTSETPVWSQTLVRATDSCRRRRRDYYVASLFTVPGSIEPGSYLLTVSQRDVVGNRDVSATRELVIKAP